MSVRIENQIVPVILVFAALLCGCDRSKKHYEPQYSDQSAPTTAPQTLTFCVVPALTPSKVVQRYQPLIDLLSTKLKQAHLPPLQLVVAKGHDDFSRRLADRSFAVAVVSSATAVQSERSGYSPFAEVLHDDKLYGALLVPKNSPIQTLDDLRGKKISFPNRSVMSGSLMIRMYLHDHGLDRDKDYTAIYCESYDSAVLTLSTGRSDAAGVGSSPWALLARSRPDLASSMELRFQTDPMPQAVMIAAADFPPAALHVVRDTLFHLRETPEGRAALQTQNVDGYGPADDATLAPVQQFVDHYKATFGTDDF